LILRITFNIFRFTLTEVLLLVCHCNRLSDRARGDSIRHGASSIAEPRRLFEAIVEPIALSQAG
jgi:hypothetical protein